MPTVGQRRSSADMSAGYMLDEMAPLATQFRNVARDILSESGMDIFNNPVSVMQLESTREALKDLFVNESADPNGMSQREYEDHMNDMEALFENDRSAVLEYASMNQFNPVIGMTFPIHKNILMNCIFDKGAIPKFVAQEPKFTVTMESRILVTPDGKEIDMFLEQNKIFDAVESTAPVKDTIIELPELETTDVLKDTFGADPLDDNLSIESAITQILFQSYVEVGETYFDNNDGTMKVADDSTKGDHFIWVKIRPIRFAPSYGEFDRTMTGKFSVTKKRLVDGVVVSEPFEGVFQGYTRKNKFMIMCSNAAVVNAKLSCRIDTSSAMLRTCSVRWKTTTDIVEIPNAIPINTPISPEEVKDIGALYQVNQLTKIMSMFKLVLANYKDDKIHKFIDDSFRTMPEANKIARTFDFAPREGYYSDHVEWRQKTFMDALDTHVTQLLQVLNDPNMTISIFGAPDLIRKITPTEYTYTTPSNVGPIDLDYVKTVVTSDKRVYQFVSSDKLRGNANLIIILCPRNSERIIYRIYDYQMYISNEIRNYQNPALPAIHAFERWKFVEYQPVQGRIKILNPTGMTNIAPNDDPIGTQSYSDFNLLK